MRNFFIKFFVGLLSLPVFLSAQGQTGMIQGTIYDHSRMEPLSNVNVVLLDTQLGTVSDDNGGFTLNSVPTGEYTILLSHIGYSQVENGVSISAGETLNLEFEMKSAAVEFGRNVVVLERRTDSRTVENLLEQRLSNTDEVINGVEGLTVIRKGNANADPVVRGLKAGRINVTIDGMKITPACPGRMDPPTTYMEIGNLQSMEVVKGPKSVTMGTNNLGGSINLISRKPGRYQAFTLNGEAEASYYSAANGRKGNIELSGGSEPYSFRLHSTYQKYGNYRSGAGVIQNTGFERFSYGGTLNLFPMDNSTLEFSALGNLGIDTGYPALPMDAPKDDGRIYSVSFDKERLSRSWLRLESKVYLSTVDHVMNNYSRPNAMMPMETVSNTQTIGGEVHNLFSFGGQMMKVGADFYSASGDATRTIESPMMTMVSKIWPDVTVSDMGLFAEYQQEVSQKLNYRVGMRGDLSHAAAGDFSEGFQNFWGDEFRDETSDFSLSGNVGMNYQLSPELKAGASVSRGNRVPEFSEFYAFYFINQLDNYDYVGNPNLNNEQNLNYEVSLDYEVPRLNAGVSLYNNTIENYIMGRVLPDAEPKTMGVSGVKVYENLSRAQIRGAEVHWSIHLPASLHMIGNVAYTHGRDLDHNDPLPEIPPLESTLGIKYYNRHQDFWVQLNGRFVSNQSRVSRLAGEDVTPGFSTYDLRFGLTQFSAVHIYAGVENLLDAAYYEHLNRNNIYSQGRNMYLTLQTQF